VEAVLTHPPAIGPRQRVRRRELTEIGGGFLVLACLVWFATGAFVSRPVGSDLGYNLTARFGQVDGLVVGDPVRAAGLQVGVVTDLQLDANNRPVAVLALAPNVALTRDASAAIRTQGLFGGKYVEVDPGGSDDLLLPGERIDFTQDAVVLNDILELIIAEATRGTGATDDGAATSEEAVP
jgi:phospholipid/cholesterol/gamma-HCH transport system substrate-binding protein